MAYDHLDIVFNINISKLTVTDEEGRTCPMTCADKAVLYVFAHRADRETHDCWPSGGDIALSAGVSRRTVIDSVAKLTAIGVFKSILLPFEGENTCRTNRYTLDVDRLKELVELSKPDKPKRLVKRKSDGIKGKDGKTYHKAKPSTVAFDIEAEDDELEATAFDIESEDDELNYA